MKKAPAKMKKKSMAKMAKKAPAKMKKAPTKFNKGLKAASAAGKLDKNPNFKAAVDGSPAMMKKAAMKMKKESMAMLKKSTMMMKKAAGMKMKMKKK